MRKLRTAFFTATLACGPGILFAQQQSPPSNHPNSPSQNSKDVPHQEPGTNNPDVGVQRQPTPSKTPGQDRPGQSNPAQNNPDVPHQEPGTDSPDLGKQRQVTPGTATSTQSSTSKKKNRHKKHGATAPQSTTQS